MATNRKLGRTTDIRMAMLKNLTTDLLVYGKVETTLPRAKEVKAIAYRIEFFIFAIQQMKRMKQFLFQMQV